MVYNEERLTRDEFINESQKMFTAYVNFIKLYANSLTENKKEELENLLTNINTEGLNLISRGIILEDQTTLIDYILKKIEKNESTLLLDDILGIIELSQIKDLNLDIKVH